MDRPSLEALQLSVKYTSLLAIGGMFNAVPALAVPAFCPVAEHFPHMSIVHEADAPSNDPQD